MHSPTKNSTKCSESVGKLGVDKALSGVDEIDYQGKMLMSVAGKPAMWAALAYFGLLYLSEH